MRQRDYIKNEELQELYKKLVDPFVKEALLRYPVENPDGKKDTKALTCVPAFVGDNYGGKISPMFVGRAVNGWPTFWSNNVDEAALQVLNQNFNFDEIKNPEKYKDGEYFYNFNKCAFIQVGIQAIIKLGVKPENAWSAFVWSNLFKVSPAISGNPSGKIQHWQRKTCVEILKKEIELLKPSHIIFFTDEDWMKNTWYNKPELASFYKVFDFNNDYSNEYIKGTGKYNNIPYIVCIRPEQKKRDEFAQAIFEAFEYLES